MVAAATQAGSECGAQSRHRIGIARPLGLFEGRAPDLEAQLIAVEVDEFDDLVEFPAFVLDQGDLQDLTVEICPGGGDVRGCSVASDVNSGDRDRFRRGTLFVEGIFFAGPNGGLTPQLGDLF